MMKRLVDLCVLVFATTFLFCAPSSRAQGTFTAASCNYSDVNAVVNGPSHTAVDGDTINIPAGTCTWASSLSVTKNVAIVGSGTQNSGTGSFGAGTLNTVIKDNAGSSNPLIGVKVNYSPGAVVRISTLDIEPDSSSTSLTSAIQIAGTCTSSGCPNVRVDNIGFGLSTQWNEGSNGSNADWMIRLDNVFGVLDHNTLPNGTSGELFNANLSAYLGVGAYGDSSWAQPDSFGGPNALYAENNIVFTNQAMNDCDVGPAGGAVGGCRTVLRYNQVTLFSDGAPGFALSIVHGLDTDGRPRSGRQMEAYGNAISLPGTSGYNTATIGWRGGTGFDWGNTIMRGASAGLNNIMSYTIYRNVYDNTPFGYCGGLNSKDPWDTNDNAVYFSGTITSASDLTMTDSTKSWATGQLAPTGAPYTIYDVTQGFMAEIISNSATSVSVDSPISESGWSGFNTGDSYEIIRAMVCADQIGRGQGNLVSGSNPTPSAPLNEALDPVYEWNNSINTGSPTNMGPNDSARAIANRDWYTDNSKGAPRAQTSPSSPFSCNGSNGGVGFGSLSNRPSSCSGACTTNGIGCGYFATDQGTQGTLYVWEAGGWLNYYAPYAYPHPLITGGSTGTGGNPPNTPPSLRAVAN